MLREPALRFFAAGLNSLSLGSKRAALHGATLDLVDPFAVLVHGVNETIRHTNLLG
jgi:hypothetical protein